MLAVDLSVIGSIEGGDARDLKTRYNDVRDPSTGEGLAATAYGVFLMKGGNAMMALNAANDAPALGVGAVVVKAASSDGVPFRRRLETLDT